MDESILTSIRNMVVSSEECTEFDKDLIPAINATLFKLTQIGVGPSEGFYITDDSEVWSDFTDNLKLIAAVKEYVYMNVRLIFDPPQSSAALESLKQIIDEMTWRLNVAAET